MIQESFDGSPFMAVLRGNVCSPPPVWIMRQAGRYLPEYRALRSQAGTFLDLCYNPELAAEVTLQPIRRFGFDAAILFSDILVIPDALGQKLWFAEGEGPRLGPLPGGLAPEAMPRLRPHFESVLAPVYETVRRVRSGLPGGTPLIGFAGAPWTLATYMIAGQGTRDQAPARLAAYHDPKAFQDLIDLLTDSVAEYLIAQAAAGVQAVKLFDSWAGVLPKEEFRRWVILPHVRLMQRLRHAMPDLPVTGFPRGAGAHLSAYVEALGPAGLTAVALDEAADLDQASAIASGLAIQGNLDPMLLRAGGGALDRGVDAILSIAAKRPLIFNLGHGITPDVPIAHVERMLKRVRG